jgi:hypothetical protein
MLKKFMEYEGDCISTEDRFGAARNLSREIESLKGVKRIFYPAFSYDILYENGGEGTTCYTFIYIFEYNKNKYMIIKREIGEDVDNKPMNSEIGIWCYLRTEFLKINISGKTDR